MVKEDSYLRDLFSRKKDSRFESPHILTQVLRTGFMTQDSASSIYCFGVRQSFRFGVDTSLKRRLVKNFFVGRRV